MNMYMALLAGLTRTRKKSTKSNTLFISLKRGVSLLGALGILLWAVPAFALTITQNANIAAGQAAFGPSVALFNWTDFFPTGTTWSFGVRQPQKSGDWSATDPVSGNTITTYPGSSINLGDWIDGDGFSPNGVGFNDPNGAAAPDLALNGAESFTLQFTNFVSKVGLAIATGTSNLPTEIDHLGAVFQVTTNTGDQGTLTLADSGQGYTAWVTIESSTPFQTLTFFETSGDIYDQYFGNILTPAVSSNASPACETAQAIPTQLWPPNHKLVPASIVGVTDPDDDAITLTVTSIRQDEPVNRLDNADTCSDASVQGSKILLRAERAGPLNGRVYHINFTADDGHGGQCKGVVTVCVPHDQSGSLCIDDGPLFDSTLCPSETENRGW